jgi:hypothetical protein
MTYYFLPPRPTPFNHSLSLSLPRARARAFLQVCWADTELYDLAKELMDKQLAFCRIKKSKVN